MTHGLEVAGGRAEDGHRHSGLSTESVAGPEEGQVWGWEVLLSLRTFEFGAKRPGDLGWRDRPGDMDAWRLTDLARV